MVMIVETSSNQLFDVRPADGIDHAWIGTEVKRVKGGGYAPKANARPILAAPAAQKARPRRPMRPGGLGLLGWRR